MRRLAPLIISTYVLLCAACSSNQKTGVVEAAKTPLYDVNLIRVDIPPILLAAEQAPYAPPSDNACETLNQIIAELDLVLEPDLDVDLGEEEQDLLDKSRDKVESSALNALRRSAADIIPYRGWVRKLSGAERHSQTVEAAINAGIVRRAFIKGMRVGQGCGADGDGDTFTVSPSD